MKRFGFICAVATSTLYAQDTDEMLLMMRTGPVETAYDLGVASATAKLYAYMQNSVLIPEEDAVETASIAADRLRRACGQTAALKGLAATVRLRLTGRDSIGTGSPEGDGVALEAFAAGVARLEELGDELCSLTVDAAQPQPQHGPHRPDL
ncbi:MAG: hypothetical protein F4089_10960 [Gammaproteobacteria bacterium]|nr:hypothetical protein [Gammaproteobacteria bacterium]